MTMTMRSLGGTGIQVSTYCLGTMMFGADGNSDVDECHRILNTALDAGINFVDTADAYGAAGGETEAIVGNALKGRRDNTILATKFHFPMADGPNHGGNSRRWIVRAVEDSLRRLKTDWIDLYQVHRADPDTDIEETLSALTDLVYQGKIRAFGCSSFPAEYIVEAQYVSETRGLLRMRTEQPPYSILTRGVERAVLPTCKRYNMGVLTWSPLGWGFLTGRVRRGAPVDVKNGRARHDPSRFDASLLANAAKFDAVEQLMELASDNGCTLPQLAVAFPLAHKAVTSVILGPRTMTQLEDLLAGADLALSDQTLDRIDEINPPGNDLAVADWACTPPGLNRVARRRAPGDRAAGSSH